MYELVEVDGSDIDTAETLRRFNAMASELFPPLTESHLNDGYWWLVYHGEDPDPVAFAGMVTMEPFEETAYFKRCLCLHTGHGLQLRLMYVREVKARDLGYKRIVSECAADSYSNFNFRRAHFEIFTPEQPWGKPGDVYWRKTLA